MECKGKLVVLGQNKYVVTIDGSVITKPMSMTMIIQSLGQVKTLEAKGFRLVRVS
jgi:hypothetical protein